MNTSQKTFILLNLFLLMISHASQSIAMEREENNVIKGNLCIVPNSPLYADGMMLPETVKSQLNIKDNDMMVAIVISSEESSNWHNGHPQLDKSLRMPDALPYRLLKGKKEGDILTLPLHEKYFILHTTQLSHHYGRCGVFHDLLERLKDRFMLTPDFLVTARESLLRKGIIVRDGNNFSHGPNGFKDE